ncbi:TetR/AcrR family transcriptional regulator [Mycolicibacterium elephantis]|uniref:TetR/AcrR family transcriptional regulator n=1 Tax=Mycolicibacterium elephantis TaxID=81858 RepID=UPI003A843850
MAANAHDDVKVQQIRRAAHTLFLRHGFAGVSTAALAKEAGVSKETLYSRFPNKDAVLADVLEHLIALGDSGDDADVPAPETLADLRHAFRSLAHDLGGQLIQRDYIELVRIVVAETPRLPHVGEIFRRSVPQRAFQRTGELLAAGKQAGLVGDVDVTTAARMFLGPLVLHALLNLLLVAPGENESPVPPVDVDQHVDLFLAAITAPNPSRRTHKEDT